MVYIHMACLADNKVLMTLVHNKKGLTLWHMLPVTAANAQGKCISSLCPKGMYVVVDGKTAAFWHVCVLVEEHGKCVLTTL